ncbi:MAG: hypothetical protein M0Z78_08965 [Betaproteobacteria bacterium]|nr:hypothetical protein [Betaproteobacteria bacterium]
MIRFIMIPFLMFIPMTAWGGDLGLPYLTDPSPKVYLDNQAGLILNSVYDELRSTAGEMVDVIKQKNTNTSNRNTALYYSLEAPFGQYGTWARFVIKDQETEVYGLQISNNGDPLSFQERLGGLTAFIFTENTTSVKPGDQVFLRLISQKGYVSFATVGKPGSIFRGSSKDLTSVPDNNNPLMVLGGDLHNMSGESLAGAIQNFYNECSNRGTILDFVAYILMDHQTSTISLSYPKDSLNSMLPSILTKLRAAAFNGCSTGGL